MTEEQGNDKGPEEPKDESVVERNVRLHRENARREHVLFSERMKTWRTPGEAEAWEDPPHLKAVSRASWRKYRTRVLVLQADQDMDVRRMTHKGAKARTGTYLPETAGTFRLNRWLPPGHYLVYRQGDPEPVKIEPPAGLTALDVQLMYGRWTMRAAGAGLERPVPKIEGRWIVAGVGGAVLAVLGTVYYGWQYGGWFAMALLGGGIR